MRALIRFLIRLHPPQFRERFGKGMEEAWEDGAHAAGGRARRWRFTLVTVLGLLRSAGLERLSPTIRSSTPRERMMMGVWTDLRVSARALLRRPGYLSIAVITIGLGIGANTAIFSLIHGVLLTPLDYVEPETLVVMGAGRSGDPQGFSYVSMPEVEGVRALASVEAAAGTRSAGLVLTGEDQPALRLGGAQVTHPIMEMFRVAPRLGRDLTLQEATWVENDQIVLSHELWITAFAGDPDIVGRVLTLDGGRWTVVGVGPEGFDYPDGAQFWTPGGRRQEGCWWGCNNFEVVGRLAPGATRASLEGELAALSLAFETENPSSQTTRELRAKTLLETRVGEVAGGLWVLMATVGVVLLIACVNVANLMLVRGQARRGEIAVRAALGAGRGRLIRSVLAEGAILSGVGASLGLGLAAGVLALLPRLAGGSIPRLENVALSSPVLGFTLVATVVATGMFALLPAVQISREGISGALRSAGRGSGTHAGSGLRRVLLAGEVAMSLVLLIGAGLLLRTFSEITRVDPGYATENIVRFNMSLPGYTYDEPAEVDTYVRSLEDRLEAIPGVRSAAAGMGTPLSSMAVGTSVRIVDRPTPDPGEGPSAAMRAVSPGYFELQEMEILEGRGFDGSEQLGDTSSYIVNQAFVDEYLADRENPVGTPLRLGVNFGFNNIPGYLVGVVEDVRTTGVIDDPAPEVYVAHAQYTPTFFTMNVLTTPGAEVARDIREAVRALDPNVPITSMDTIEEAVRAERASARFYLALLGAFAGLAVILAAVGLYGVVSYLVEGRTREFGIRTALGADRPGIMRMVLQDGLKPAVAGLGVGILVALGAARVLRSLLYGVAPLDPVTFITVPLLLLAVSVLALLAPARRATRVDPVHALRSE